MNFCGNGGQSAADSFAHPLAGQQYADMMILRNTTSARCSSWDRSGRNMDYRPVEPGETLEIANIEGAGCIRRIYFTLGPRAHYMYDLTLRMYWDGQDTPCVEVPFGDFFGMRFERIRLFQSSMVTISPGLMGAYGLVGFTAYFPMPFAKGARITLTNEGSEQARSVWSHVDYEKLKYLPGDVGRFHAQWRRVNPTVAAGPEPNNPGYNGVNLDGKDNYVILEAEGMGNVAGYFLHVDNIAGGWYGEGDDMIFIDGEEWPPSIHGTGSEEIFGGGACPNSEYIGPCTGYLYTGGNEDFSGKNSMYRFYVADPIRFTKSIRMTIEHGHANCFANDYSSTVFWYQDEPHAAFPKLPPVEKRYPRQGADEHDRAHQAYMDLQSRVIRMRYETGQRTAEEIQRLDGIQKELDVVAAGLAERRNEWVLKECETIAPKVEAVEKGLEG
jgi:hypothetical protein